MRLRHFCHDSGDSFTGRMLRWSRFQPSPSRFLAGMRHFDDKKFFTPLPPVGSVGANVSEEREMRQLVLDAGSRSAYGTMGSHVLVVALLPSASTYCVC